MKLTKTELKSAIYKLGFFAGHRNMRKISIPAGLKEKYNAGYKSGKDLFLKRGAPKK